MDDNHIILHINIKTGLKDSFIKFEDNQIILGIKSLPLKNKANNEIINLLSTIFHTDSINVKILNGTTTNSKTIKIIDPQYIPNELL